MTDHSKPTFLGTTITRRSMLGSSAGIGGLVIAGCTRPAPRPPPDESGIGAPDREPTPPTDLGPEEEYLFFTAEQARTVEAIAARIIPGDDEDPGAVQAGAPIYIDRKLAQFEDFPDPTYHAGPFAEEVEHGEEFEQADGDGAAAVPVREAEMYRYGFQSELNPQQTYQLGLAGLDLFSQTRHGSLFADLDEEIQDEVLRVLDAALARSEDDNGGGNGNGNGDENADGNGEENDGENGPTDAVMDQAKDLFGQADPGGFFDTVRTDTIEGMFCDPMYGGNRNLVGWTLVGWPGAQRSYSPYEMVHGTNKQPMSMEGLTPMQPDRPGGQEGLEQDRHRGHDH